MNGDAHKIFVYIRKYTKAHSITQKKNIRIYPKIYVSVFENVSYPLNATGMLFAHSMQQGCFLKTLNPHRAQKRNTAKMLQYRAFSKIIYLWPLAMGIYANATLPCLILPLWTTAKSSMTIIFFFDD